MSVYLRIEVCPPEYSARGLVLLEPSILEEQQLKPGDVVEITSGFGKSVVARVAPAPSSDAGQELIFMDQHLTQAIKSMIGDLVEVEKVSVSSVEKVILAPLIDVAHITGLESYLAQSLTKERMPLSRRSLIYVTFPGGTAGCQFRVIGIIPERGIVTEDTAIEVKHVFTTWPELKAEVTFEDVGGLRKELRLVRELVELPLRFPDSFRQLGINPPRGIILYGPAGCGKTRLTRAIANELDAEFFYLNGPEIIGTHYGETEANLRKIFDEASHHLPSIIFVDEVDTLAPKRGESGTLSDTRMTAQFLEALDGLKNVEGVMVIGTTNRIDSIDHATRRPGRFDREIFFGPPDRNGRLEILHIHTRGMPISEEARACLPEIAKNTHGFVGADLMETCREAGLNALRRQIGDEWSSIDRLKISLTDLKVEKEDFLQAISKLRPSALRESVTMIPDVGWDDIGGMEDTKERLQELVEKPLLHPEVFVAMGAMAPTGILLHGPPGTGKTLLAQAVANQCNANFISVKGAEIFSKWIGESEEAIRHIFRIARQAAPTIIFLDQLDAIAPRRAETEGGSRTAERVVNQLLAELDGIEPLSGITVIGATNRFELLDPAILRPGRFGTHIYVGLPDRAGREAVFRLSLKDAPMDGTTTLEGILKVLAPSTDGLSGAEIKAICQETKLSALRSANFEAVVPLRLEHFQEALSKVSAARQSYNQENEKRPFREQEGGG
ncbi:AAA family ATPase [Chloroflexota bacterium]